MKKIYILPNLITTANLICGFLSMVYAIQSDFTRACWFIVIAGVCDSLDGRVARMAKAESSFGVQYDSLSDLTSFGIAPAILSFAFALHDLSRFGVSIAAFYCVCAALRLARFNVDAEINGEKKETPEAIARAKKIRKGYFQGMPSPASAGLVITSILMQIEFKFLPDEFVKYFILGVVGLLALLMVSSIPFPTFKEVNWRARGKAWILMIPLVVILFIIQAPEATLFVIGYTYLFFGLAWAAYLTFFRDKKQEMKSPIEIFSGGHE